MDETDERANRANGRTARLTSGGANSWALNDIGNRANKAIGWARLIRG